MLHIAAQSADGRISALPHIRFLRSTLRTQCSRVSAGSFSVCLSGLVWPDMISPDQTTRRPDLGYATFSTHRPDPPTDRPTYRLPLVTTRYTECERRKNTSPLPRAPLGPRNMQASQPPPADDPHDGATPLASLTTMILTMNVFSLCYLPTTSYRHVRCPR